MRNVSTETITEVFNSYIGQDANPRLREVMMSLAKHLHEFALETRLTHDEWRLGIQMLRETGEITTDDRDEWTLLSDVLGISAIVDMVNSAPGATSASALGPFHVSNSPPLEVGGDLKKDFEDTLLLVEGFVKDTEGNPLEGAEIEIWQTAPNGLYASQDPEQDQFSFQAQMTTGKDGRYAFTTVRPVSYPVPTDGPIGRFLTAAGRHPWRPSHLHFIVKIDGYRTLVTEVFPDDDPYLDTDTVFGVREDLIMKYIDHPAEDFPEGFALSGTVTEPFQRVDFDLVLLKQ